LNTATDHPTSAVENKHKTNLLSFFYQSLNCSTVDRKEIEPPVAPDMPSRIAVLSVRIVVLGTGIGVIPADKLRSDEGEVLKVFIGLSQPDHEAPRSRRKLSCVGG